MAYMFIAYIVMAYMFIAYIVMVEAEAAARWPLAAEYPDRHVAVLAVNGTLGQAL